MSAGRWNLLMYVIAGDPLQHQNCLDAIAGMHAALTFDQCNIAVQVMTKGRTARYWISSGHEIRTEGLGDIVDASRPKALTSFINAASKTFPASSTALVLWAHGAGLDHVHHYSGKGGGHGGGGLGGGGLEIEAARDRTAAPGHGATLGRAGLGVKPAGRPESYGCRWGPDPNTGRFLTNVGMKNAIAASVPGRVDLLGLNACWMATLEIEYELRHVAAIEIACQVYARPWPYPVIVESLSRAPAQSAEQLAQTIVASVRSEIALGRRHDALSAFRAGPAMDALAAAFDTYAKRVTMLIDTDWEGVCEAVMSGAQRIDDPHQVDLASLTSVLGKQDQQAKAAAAAVAAQLDAMLIGHTAHASHPGVHGLSIFCPKSIEVDLADAYQGTEFRTNSWAAFLVKFQRRLASS